MFNTNLHSRYLKRALFLLITLWIYVSIGICRGYVSLLFYQLELPDTKFRLNDNEKTWIASCVGILSPVSSIIGGSLLDIIGRKRCVCLMFVPFMTAWIIVSISSNYTMLLIGMVTESIGMGMGLCVVTYISEISPKEYRGLLIALIDATFNFGVIFCNLLMYFLKWYIVSIIFAIFTTISLLLTFTLPESPLWLYSKGKKENAIQTLCVIRSKEANQLESEINDLEKSYSNAPKKTGALQTLKSCVKSWKQFLIASVFFLLLILAGPFLFISYNVVIVNDLKLPYDSALITVIYSTAAFGGSLLTPLIMHKCKRKKLAFSSAAGMCLSLLVIGIYQEMFNFKDEKPFPWIIPVAMCSYVISCNIGVLPMGLVIGGELFPFEVRGTLQGIFGFLLACNWTLSMKFYPLILFNFGVRMLIWVLFSCSLVLALFAIFVLPETKDKTLNEIQEQYFNRNNKHANSVRA